MQSTPDVSLLVSGHQVRKSESSRHPGVGSDGGGPTELERSVSARSYRKICLVMISPRRAAKWTVNQQPSGQ